MARCRQCRRNPQDRLSPGFCEACYKSNLEGAFTDLPRYPKKLELGNESKTCTSCNVEFPRDLVFKDSREHFKCVMCRKWELMHRIERVPGTPINKTLGEGRRIKCFQCGEKNTLRDHEVEVGKWEPRISMFCPACRHVEDRYAQQNIVNAKE